MKSWEVLAAIAALAAGLWAQVQVLVHWLKGFVVATRWVDAITAANVLTYLATNGKRMTREPAYFMRNYHVKPLGRAHWVAAESMLTSRGVTWLRHRPVWLSKEKEAADADDSYKYTFHYIRGTIDFEKLLLDAAVLRSGTTAGTGYTVMRHQVHYHHGRTLGAEIAQQKAESSGREKKYSFSWDATCGDRLLHWKPEEVGGKAAPATFASMALSKALLAHVEEVRFWRKSKKWYTSRGIAWRRGYLYEGPPGTGKTSMVRATGEELDLPVHIFDIATMSNEDLREAWEKMAADAPCIALIEDVDAVFRGRENIATHGGLMSSGGLTFDALLNCIDGVERHDGVLLVLTTNHAEQLDPALRDRQGRVDRRVVFDLLDYPRRLKIAEMVLGKGDEATRMAMESEDCPASTFVEKCCRSALEKLYEERPAAAGPYR